MTSGAPAPVEVGPSEDLVGLRRGASSYEMHSSSKIHLKRPIYKVAKISGYSDNLQLKNGSTRKVKSTKKACMGVVQGVA